MPIDGVIYAVVKYIFSEKYSMSDQWVNLANLLLDYKRHRKRPMDKYGDR